MKRILLALYCAAMILLPACSGPLQIPFEYADAPAQAEKTENIPLQSAVTRQDAAPRGSLKTAPAPSPEATPDIDAAIEQADESLEGGDDSLIEDLSVAAGGGVPAGPVSELLAYTHYIESNDLRYQSFLSAFPSLTAASSLALVNVNADFGYYNGVSVIREPDDLLVLCNKNYQLPSGFVPQDLRGVGGTSHKMAAEAAEAFEAMQKAIKEELSLPLVVLSGYRDYAYQKGLYARYAKADGADVADTYSARAGHSEHQTGLAIDFLHKLPGGSLRGAGFQNTAQYAWLQSHAHRYGFILRYPEGYEPITGYRFEPWHWRYIGAEDAARMAEEGFATFEEYIGTYYPPQAAAIRAAG